MLNVCKKVELFTFVKNSNLLIENRLHQFQSNGGGGIRIPLDAPNTLLQNTDKSATEIAQSLEYTGAYEKPQTTDFEQKLTLPEHASDTFLHQKCAKCVHKISPDDLKELINKWPKLPDHIKLAIGALIQTSTR
ncbi:MAG: hypothetical protein P8016_09550 [Sedimentisphaerales bacterium]